MTILMKNEIFLQEPTTTMKLDPIRLEILPCLYQTVTPMDPPRAYRSRAGAGFRLSIFGGP